MRRELHWPRSIDPPRHPSPSAGREIRPPHQSLRRFGSAPKSRRTSTIARSLAHATIAGALNANTGALIHRIRAQGRTARLQGRCALCPVVRREHALSPQLRRRRRSAAAPEAFWTPRWNMEWASAGSKRSLSVDPARLAVCYRYAAAWMPYSSAY